MKKITDKEYKDYQEYKKALTLGRIITPDGLRIICNALENDPEAIGKHFLTMLHEFESEDCKALPPGNIFKLKERYGVFSKKDDLLN